MTTNESIQTHSILPDTHAVTAHVPVPGLGVLPVNAFVIEAREPVLVDAGVVAMKDGYFDAIRRALPLERVRYIWLTHTDADHTGALERLLDAAPHARLITTYLGMGKLGLRGALDPMRVYLLNPGQRLNVGDRELVALKPPSYDAPETTGLFDTKSRALFSADCFGAVLDAPAESARAIDEQRLREGTITWTRVDAPWLADVDAALLGERLRAYLALGPEHVFSSHLPPASGMNEELASYLLEARAEAPFVGPDQRALLEMVSAA